MKVTQCTQENFTQEVLENPKTVLIDFYADWCGPCRTVAPIMEEISAENDTVSVVKVNIDEEPELAATFGVMSIPTLVVVKNGKPVTTSVGAKPKAAILKLIEG